MTEGPVADRKIVLVTGANAGLGLATLQAIWRSSDQYHILATGRSLSKLQNACAELRATKSPGGSSVEELELDITNDESIQKAVKYVEDSLGRIDALVNNAGGGCDTDYMNGTMSQREAWNNTMDINLTSPQVVTTEFAPLLLKSSNPRLLFVTSGMASLVEEHDRKTTGEGRQPKYTPGWPKPQRKQSSNAYAYRVSKAALNMALLIWVRILEADGVKCFGISPGFLATNLAGDPEIMRRAGAADPILGGEFILRFVRGEMDRFHGSIVRRDESVQAW